MQRRNSEPFSPQQAVVAARRALSPAHPARRTSEALREVRQCGGVVQVEVRDEDDVDLGRLDLTQPRERLEAREGR